MDVQRVIILADLVLAKFVKSQVYNKIGLNRGELRVLLYIHSLGECVTNRYLLRKCRNFRSPVNSLLNVNMVISKLLYCEYIIREGNNIIITDKGLILCARFKEFGDEYFSQSGEYNYYYTQDSH